MKTVYLQLDEQHIDAAALHALKEAGNALANGALVAFPTETVYGLGGMAFDKEAAKKIYAAKGRPSDNPLIVHVAATEDVKRLAKDIPDVFYRLADAFWPGPLTCVLHKQNEVPYETTGGLDTVAVRFPSLTIAQELIKASGGFVAAPSANLSGRPSPTTAAHCKEDLDGRVDYIIDGGSAVLGIESTVLDLTGEEPVILRPGFITGEMLQDVLGRSVVTSSGMDEKDPRAPKAPGMKYRHYAPNGTLLVVTGEADAVAKEICARLKQDKEQGLRTGVICCETKKARYEADRVVTFPEKDAPRALSKMLFFALREMDAFGIDAIYAEGVSEEGVGAAVMNRLVKAAGQTVIHV